MFIDTDFYYEMFHYAFSKSIEDLKLFLHDKHWQNDPSFSKGCVKELLQKMQTLENRSNFNCGALIVVS